MRDETVGTALVLLAGAGWGTIGILGKAAYATELTISSVLALRFLLGAVVLWAMLFGLATVARLAGSGSAGVDYRLPRRRFLAAVGLGAVVYAGMTGLYFWALQFMTAGMTTLLLYLYPVFVIGLSVPLLGEAVSRRVGIAAVLSFAGVGLVAGVNPEGVHLLGIVLAVGAAMGYAAYMLLSRSLLDAVDPRALAAYSIPATGGSFLAYSLLVGEFGLPTTPRQWALVLAFATVATALPIFAFFAGLSRIRASRAGLLTEVEPAVTVALGVLLLGEPFTPSMALGGALILISVYLIQTERA